MVMTLASLQAMAQEQLPTPLHERDDASADDVDTSRAYTRSKAQDDTLKWPALRPSVSLMGHLGLLNEEFDLPGYGLWAGFNHYPLPDRYNMFWSLGMKFEKNQELRTRPFSFVVAARSGFAWLKGNPFLFKNQVFANLQIYGVLGKHVPLPDAPNFWRMGVGVVSPRLAPANAMMLLWGVPLPNQIEFALDITPDGQQKELLILLGIGI